MHLAPFGNKVSHLFALAFLIALIPITSWAVDIQYELGGDNRVTGVSDTPLTSVPNYGIITLTGSTASEIIWPIPTGCSTGKSGWTKITDPGGVTVSGGGMALRTGLVIFHTSSTLYTGCREVANWNQLRAFVESTIVAAVQQHPMIDAMTMVNVVVQVVCPTGTPSECASSRSKVASINGTSTLFPTPTQLNTFLTQLITLKDDAISTKQTACSGGNSAFCS